MECHLKNSSYEIKWSPNEQAKFSKTFTEKYHPQETLVIHPDNFDKFIS